MQVFAGCVLERHEICNRFASDERGQKTFSTIVTTVAVGSVSWSCSSLRIDMSLLDWELRRLITSSAVPRDVPKIGVEIDFEIGL